MEIDSDATPQLFPTIPARVKAGEIDLLVVFGCLAVLVGLYVNLGQETPWIVFICSAVLFLYEPVLVSYRGQTIGHGVMGFRIIDATTGTNISLAKSLIRFVLKAVLGVVSLIGAFFNRRSQFLHDSMTSSMAVLRDVRPEQLAMAPAMSPQQTAVGSDADTMPSLARRIGVILLYGLSVFLLIGIAVATLFPNCAADRPTSAEQCHIIDTLTSGLLMVLWVSILVAGLRGALPGARER